MELEECVRGSLTSSDDVPPWIKNLTFELSCPLMPWKHRVQTRCKPSNWFMVRVPEEAFALNKMLSLPGVAFLTLKQNMLSACRGIYSETKHYPYHTHTHPHIYLYGCFCGFNSRASTFDAYTYNFLFNMSNALIWMPRHDTPSHV